MPGYDEIDGICPNCGARNMVKALAEAAGCADKGHRLFLYFDHLALAWTLTHWEMSETFGAGVETAASVQIEGGTPGDPEFQRACRVWIMLVHQGRVRMSVKVPGAMLIPTTMRIDDLLAAEDSLGLAA